ncbi:MAG: 30S ribosomal protein S9 [Armatimonadetes bacterium]|nr:30S ribosomal protein S9 [Armatimonadota bacterium]
MERRAVSRRVPLAEQVRYYATGRRKTAVAKVWLTPGTGQVTVNDRPLLDYLGRRTLEVMVMQPFETASVVGKFDVRVRALGGGLAGQAGAIRHGISRALVAMDENLRPMLRRLGLLTRDARMKERKKYGRKRARRGFQFSKR